MEHLLRTFEYTSSNFSSSLAQKDHYLSVQGYQEALFSPQPAQKSSEGGCSNQYQHDFLQVGRAFVAEFSQGHSVRNNDLAFATQHLPCDLKKDQFDVTVEEFKGWSGNKKLNY